jgi:uncharacterized glyoxalase superfamily protein PhnB
MTDPVVATSVDVPVDPDTAFRIFTEEYDDWWVRSPTTFRDGARAREMRMEPGVGGRIMEVYDLEADDVLVLGRITEWQPGRLLAYAASDQTELRFTFERVEVGTRLSLELRLLPGHELDRSLLGTGRAMVDFFAARASDPKHASWAGRDLPRVLPVLHYADRAAAGRWLASAFGVEGWRDAAAAMPDDFPIPLNIAGESIIMRGAQAGGASRDHGVYVYVDDLDAHFRRAQRAGARIVREIMTYGDRSYVAEDLAGHEWTFAQARPAQQGK